MFEITYDFTSNWYLNRKTSWRLRNLAFSCDRQPRGHARANKERSFTARVDRMDPVVNNDIRLDGREPEKRILRFRVPVRYFTCANILWEQWFSRLVGRVFSSWVRSVRTGSIRQILGTMLVCKRKYLVKCNCGYWINILPSRNNASLIMLKMYHLLNIKITEL